jgi:PmbA protein
MEKEKEMARYALDYALRKGCQQARVVFSSGEENEVEVRDGKVDKLHHSGGCQLSLSLFVDGAYSTISTNRLEREELERFIDKGVISTRFLEKDPYRSLPEESMYYRGEMNDFGLYDDGFKDVDVDEKIDMAKATYNEIVDERVISAMAGIADTETYNYLIDSNGFEGEKRRTLYMSTAQVSVLGEGDERPEDYYYVNAQHWGRLQKEGIGAEALRRTLSKMGACRVESGVYDVVVDRQVVSQLVSPVLMALRGEALHMQSSFLLDKRGEKIGSDKLTVVDNPRQYDKAGARLFDNEGIAVVGMPIVENGVLMNYYISNYMSKKMGVEMTQANPTIVDFALGDTDTAGLIRNLARGLYITGFNGGNCNGTTGDFSFGIEGFWVENGVIVKPVSEMLITGDMLTLWGNLVETSNDPLGYTAWKLPSMLFTGVVVN